MKKLSGLLILLGMLVGASAPAYNAPSDTKKTADAMPQEIEGVGVEEHLSQKISLSTSFTDQDGKQVALGQYFSGKKPVLMTMVYYGCPSLCNYHLNGLLEVFKKMNLRAGRDFEFVAVSMNHRETAEDALKKRSAYLNALGQPEAAAGWHFLVGSEGNVKALANELGFKFKWNENLKQYAHPSVAYVLTPQGVISRYLYGIDFPPKTLHLSLVEASDGKIGSFVDQVALFCFQFDPNKAKYSVMSFKLMQLGALLTLILLGIFFVPHWLKERRATTGE
jgi:protein SCO1/2